MGKIIVLPETVSLNEYADLRRITCELAAALSMCADVCAGNTLTKQQLITALEASKNALEKWREFE